MDICGNCATYNAAKASAQLLWECNKTKDMWLAMIILQEIKKNLITDSWVSDITLVHANSFRLLYFDVHYCGLNYYYLTFSFAQ